MCFLSDFCFTNALIFRSLPHIDLLLLCRSYSFFVSLSLTACLSFSAVSILSILFPTPVLAGIGCSSIRSSLSLSGQVGRCYQDKRTSLGPFYLTWSLLSNIFVNLLFCLRREHSGIDGNALHFFSSTSLSHLSIPPTPLSLSFSSHPQILKR